MKNKENKIFIPHDINWEYLKRFMICAECASFKEAYEKIGTSPSALNNQLDSLEKALKINLFERHTHNRNINLTLEGQYIYNLVKDMNSNLHGLIKINRSVAIEENLELNVVTTQGLADSVLYSSLEKFIQKYPHIKMSVKTELFPRKILSDELMIRSDFFTQEKLEKEFIFTYETNLYASREYIDKYGKPSSFSDLTRHKNLILSHMNMRNPNWSTLSGSNLSVMCYILSDSIRFLFDLCRSGDGILELPSIYPGVENLVKILEDLPSPSVDIYVGGLKETFSYPHITEFLNILKQDLGNKMCISC